DPRNDEPGGKPLQAQLGERLDQAAAQIEGEAIGDPLTVARMQITLGSSLLGLGYPEKAVPLFTRARATFAARLGPDHADTLTGMSSLASAYLRSRDHDRALPLLVETLKLCKSKLGPDHPHTLGAMEVLAVGYHNAGKYDLGVRLLEDT